MSTATPTTAIQTAFDVSLSTIRAQFPNVPEALAVIIASGRGKFHGRFEPSSWQDSSGSHEGSARHEIVMSSESLARTPEEVLTTLLHECAHAVAFGTGVKDTSRGNRYHNGDFAKIASDMGCKVSESPDSKHGYMTTGLTDWAIHHFASEIDLLGESLTTYRKPAEKKPTKKTTVRVACECDEGTNLLAVTVPIKWWDKFGSWSLTCSECGSSFQEV
jgi:SprT-like family